MPSYPRNDKGKFYTDPLNAVNGQSATGVLVFNRQKEPIFLNRAAFAILSKLNNGNPRLHHTTKPFSVPKEISNLFNRIKKKFGSFLSRSLPCAAIETILLPRGGTYYCCHGFFLCNQTSSAMNPYYIMILIEKIPGHGKIGVADLHKINERSAQTKR
jgi:hypothetical protein